MNATFTEKDIVSKETPAILNMTVEETSIENLDVLMDSDADTLPVAFVGSSIQVQESRVHPSQAKNLERRATTSANIWRSVNKYQIVRSFTLLRIFPSFRRATAHR